MGTSKTYNKDGGFDRQDYTQIGTTANDIKIIARNDGQASLPIFSNTPGTMYAKLSDKSDLVKQVVAFGNGVDKRAKLKDIETEHGHTNRTNKKSFSKIEIHVHDYTNGKRSATARKPSKKEKRIFMIARYGKRKN